jgi:hypothetical protein
VPPREVSPDARPGPPDFVGVGTQRSGTTWWHQLLLEHPQIVEPLRRQKEFHFFDQFCAREMTPHEIKRFHRWFTREPGQLCGEWTPRYMADPWTPPLLRRAAPDARLLVLLRDPLERFRSGIGHFRGKAPSRKKQLTVAETAERGRYATHLERLLEHFPREQVLVLQYERCRADPSSQYARTLEFLGAEDTSFVPPSLDQLVGGTTDAVKRPLWPDLEADLLELYAPEVERLTRLVPDLDVGLWPSLA